MAQQVTSRKTNPTGARASALSMRDDDDVRSFFDNAVEGMFRKSRSGAVILANPAFAKIFGYPSPGAMLRDFPKDRDNFLIDASRFLGMLEQLKSDGEIKDFEIQFKRQDGMLIWALINARAVYTTKGSIKYYEGTLVDITTRKEAEIQRSFIEEQVRQAQKLEAVGILASGMAADFGTHLHPIIKQTEAALQALPQVSPLRSRLHEILGAANKANALLTKFSAISLQRDASMQPVSMTSIALEALEELQSSLPASIDLTQDLQANPDTVLAEAGQIRQVLDNLLANAVAATLAGGTISVSLRNVVLDERTAAFRADLAPGHYVRITVQDSGIGIQDNILPRIFDPFFTTTPNSSSQGLGLSVAHGIARAHDGGVTVLSEPGLGSTFCLYIPCHERDVDQSQPLAPAPRLGSERILVIDPESKALRKWRGLLAPLGYRVDTVTGSVEALRLFMESASSFDLVITSYNMPQITGLELAKTMLGITPSTPIVLCTEQTDPVTRKLANQAGIQMVADKPLTTSTMLSILDTMLDNSAKQQTTSVSMRPNSSE